MKNRIKELRKNLGMSQQDLAEKAGVTRQSISLYELGDATPPIDVALKIARAFDLSISEIFKLEENE